jgi:hypothetical protein
LQAERGECGETAEYAGHDELPAGGAEKDAAVGIGKRGKKSDEEGAGDVHDHCAPRECLADVMGNEAGERETRQAAKAAAECYPEI